MNLDQSNPKHTMQTILSPRWAAVAFRMLFSLIFLVAGGNHLFSPEKIAGRLNNAPFGSLATSIAPAEVLVILAGIALAAGGIALLIGYRVRSAALLLIAVLVPITITVQIGAAELGPLFKNIAILGGLLHFAMVEYLQSEAPAADAAADHNHPVELGVPS